MLSSQYGWTTDQIFERTMHELDWRLKYINERMADELKLQAKLHGLEYKEPVKQQVLSDHQKRLLQSALARTQDGRSNTSRS